MKKKRKEIRKRLILYSLKNVRVAHENIATNKAVRRVERVEKARKRSE